MNGMKPSFEHPVRLTSGEEAPNFELESDEYKHYALADFKGKNVVLYFYPQAMTPFCTTEACDFRDNIERIVADGFTVIGISHDGIDALQEFREKENLNFLLLSDPEYKVHELYGTVQDENTDGKSEKVVDRSTFIITADGKIAYAEYDVDYKGHVDRLLEQLQTLK